MSDEESLFDLLAVLRVEMKRAQSHGIRGMQMAQRADDDLKRIARTAYLNLYEYSQDCEKENQQCKK